MNRSPIGLSAARVGWRVVVCALLVAAAEPQPANAAYVLIDNFESYVPGTSMNGQSNGSGVWTTDKGDGGENYFAANDQTTPGNKVLNVVNNLTEGAADPSLVSGIGSALLSDPKINIPDGSVATFFFRFWRGHPSSDVVWGFVDSSASTDVSVLEWGDFNTGLRNSITEQNGVSVGDPGRRSNFDGRNMNRTNGNELANIDIDPLLEGEWFNVWMVIHNDGVYAPLNFITDTADYMNLYIQSDQTFPVQTQLQTLLGDMKFTFAQDFTMPPPGPPTAGTNKALTAFFMRMGLGPFTESLGLENNHAGPWYLDDLYLDVTGENLTNPIPEPGTVVLAVIGLVGLFLKPRRR